MVRKRWHAISPCARLADEKKAQQREVAALSEAGVGFILQ